LVPIFNANDVYTNFNLLLSSQVLMISALGCRPVQIETPLRLLTRNT